MNAANIFVIERDYVRLIRMCFQKVSNNKIKFKCNSCLLKYKF